MFNVINSEEHWKERIQSEKKLNLLNIERKTWWTLEEDSKIESIRQFRRKLIEEADIRQDSGETQ
jgi:hypothetical protein